MENFRVSPTHAIFVLFTWWLLAAGGSLLGAATLTVSPGSVAILDDGECSLREAIHNAENDAQVDNDDCPAGAGADVLELAADAVYTLVDQDAVDNSSGLPNITTTIEISGNGATLERDAALDCTIDGTHSSSEFRLLKVFGSGDVTLTDLTMTGGCADGASNGGDGGAILVTGGNLLMQRVVLIDNHARGIGGGLAVGEAGVQIEKSAIAGNSGARASGGVGAGHIASIVDIVASTISGNSGGDEGGGGVGNIGIISIVSSTISGNNSTGTGGGGIGNQGSVTLESSTVTGNSTTGKLGGGGIGNVGMVTIKNSLVVENGAGGDCAHLDVFGGTFAAEGDNLDTDGSCVALDADFDTVAVADLALGDLGANGGPTATHALLGGSVAIDAVADCTFIDASPDTEDQRGFTRPQDGDDNGTATCDIGAFEYSDEDEGVGDGVEDGVDNCPDDINADQADDDGDGVGDVCDACQGDDATGDADKDGICFDRDCDDDDGLGVSCWLFGDGFESGGLSEWSSSSP